MRGSDRQETPGGGWNDGRKVKMSEDQSFLARCRRYLTSRFQWLLPTSLRESSSGQQSSADGVRERERRLLEQAKDRASMKDALDIIRETSRSSTDYDDALTLFEREMKVQYKKHSVEPPSTAQYDIAEIRSLLKDAFTAEELRRFCQDRPYLRPILSQFGPRSSLDDLTDIVIEYCQTHRLFSELLAEVAEMNPRQYSRYYPRLQDRKWEDG